MEKKFIELINKFTVGVPEIDAQHEHLVNLSGCLSVMCYRRRRTSDFHFAMTIKNTLYFVNFHINYEEKLMLETAYPGLEEHKNFHKVFFMDFLKQIRAFESRANFIPEKLPDFLYDWLDPHFIMDMDMGLHVKKSGYFAMNYDK